MKLRRAQLTAFLAALLCSGVVPLGNAPSSVPSAIAQPDDDWSVKRDPFDAKVVARYKAILKRNPNDSDALAKLARMYERYRSLAKLIGEYDAAIAANANDASAWTVLAHLRSRSGDSAAALTAFERAAALAPTDVGVQMSLAVLLNNAGRSDDARQALERALAAKPPKAKQLDILRGLADIARSAGKIDEVRKHYEAYLALDDKDVAIRLALGDALTQFQKYVDAVAVYRDAEKRLAGDPARRVDVIGRLGRALEGAGDEDGAIAEYRRAIGLVRRGYYLERELTTRIVDIYRRRQDLATLITYYDKAWPVSKRGHFEWDTMARLYEETGNQEAAIDAFGKATKKAPYELDTQRRLISLLENSGREDDALKQYEIVVKVAPGEPRFQLELAERYWTRGMAAKALVLLSRLEQRFPGDAGVHAAVADLYTRWGKEALALAAYERLARIEPDDPQHLVNLGEQHYQRGQKAKAIAVWKRIANAKSADAYARLGEVFAEHDLLPDALQMYEKAIKLAAQNPAHYRGRAAVYERQKSYVEALADWERALAHIPNDAANKLARREARRRFVNLLTRTGGRKENEYHGRWRAAFRVSPPDVESGYFLVEYYLRRNKASEARSILESLLDIDPKDLMALEDLVKLYRGEREYEKAVALLLRLVDLSPGREREYFTQIAEIKTDDRKDDEAIFYAQKALEKSPTDPLAHQRLAERYAEMQQFDKAIEAYERAIALDQRNFKAAFSLAQLYVHGNRAADASALYREILKRATDDDTVRKAGREAIDIEELLGTLGDLERIVAPLAFAFSHKDVYRRTIVDLYGRYVPRLVEELERGDAAVRAARRAELDRLGTHGLKPLLEALADDDDIPQQRIAVAVLGYLGNPAAAAPLVRLAKQEPPADDRRARVGSLLPSLDWEVRVDALVAAGRLGDPRVLPSLLELANHAEVAMREAAIFAAGQTRDRKAIPLLEKSLADRRESVQVLGCLGLGAIGDAKVAPRLVEVVRDRKVHELTRAACGYTLGLLGATKTRAVLEDVLGEGNGQAQRLAAIALGYLGQRESVPALLSAYFSRTDEVRVAMLDAVARIVGKIPRPSVAGIGFPMRSGKFDPERAVAELGASAAQPVVPISVVVANGDAVSTGIEAGLGRHRDLIVRVLRDLDDAPERISLGALTTGLPAASASERAQAEATIATIGARLLPTLTGLMKHDDSTIRALAPSVAAKIGGAEALEPVLAGLGDRASSVRNRAIEAAERLAKATPSTAPTIVAALEKALLHPDWRDRRAAAGALGHLEAEPKILSQALSDDNAYVRQAVADALRGQRALASLQGLQRALADDVGPVRIAAAKALLSTGDATARGWVQAAAANDPSAVIRAALSELVRSRPGAPLPPAKK